MKTNISFVVLSAAAIVLSMLACNMGTTTPSTESAPPSNGEATAVASPVAESPTEAPQNNSNPANSACANPYMPVIVGAIWNYKLSGPAPDTYTHSILNVEAGGFTEQDVFGAGVTRQGKWNCDNGNLIALNPAGGGSASVQTEGMTSEFQTTALEGVTLPASINIGDSWSQSVTIEGTQTLNGTTVPSKNQTTSNCTATGMESVTVDAGIFDALRVDCQNTMLITVTIDGNSTELPLVFSAMNWYAQGVGLIKTVSTGSNMDSVVELVSYSIP
ncbi:MAG: hypothetical protein HYZ23_03435 [Chloroflexi bacterium]|nr:hypothetical protein [Chloroflexota bacterium]